MSQEFLRFKLTFMNLAKCFKTPIRTLKNNECKVNQFSATKNTIINPPNGPYFVEIFKEIIEYRNEIHFRIFFSQYLRQLVYREGQSSTNFPLERKHV